MSEETITEEETKTEPAVLVLPGHLFFTDRIDLPTSLEEAEIDDFAELSLEGLAPFPVDQLYWGYIHSESAGCILLYAAYKERVKAQGFKDLDAYIWVLPDFAITAGAYFPEATTLVIESKEASSHITLNAGETMPESVISYPSTRAGDATKSEINCLRVSLDFTEMSDQGLPTFHFIACERADEDFEGKWKKLNPTQSQLWRADVRDPDFKKAERNTRKLTSWVTRATGYAAWFAVFLILLEVALYLGTFWLESQTAKIAEQEPEVRRVEDKQSLMNKLDQVAQNELRPVAILEALNSKRPEGIYFTSTVTEGHNRITIDGIANTINELNAYTTDLRESGRFKLLNDPKTLTRGGKTTFTATLDYIHSEEASTPAEVEAEVATEEDTNA